VPVDVLLWDFGDTLVDERWMRRSPAGCPEWEAAWAGVMAELAGRWDVGAIDMGAVFDAMAVRCGMPREDVHAHARWCCEHVDVREHAWRLASERRRPQALVTVNPDLFTELVVPQLGLRDVFDVVVASHQVGSDDKNELCAIALDRLGFDGPRSSALLVDNRLDLIDAWRAVGGAGYLVGDDRNLAEDLRMLLGDARP
jgi:FMN phosphatase YigB (HAD superfamily)